MEKKEEKEMKNLLELDLSSFEAKEVLIFFKDKERKPLRIIDPKESYWVNDFFKYITKNNFEHWIHGDYISEIKTHR